MSSWTIELLPTSTGRASFDYKAKRFVRSAHLPPLEAHHGWKEIFSPTGARGADPARASPFDPVDLLRARFEETEGAGFLARLQDVDLGTYLVETDDLLVKTDRASMAHSLEARVPFLDPIVTNLALALLDPPQGARTLQEGAAPQGGGTARPARGARQEARLLDSSRGLAAGRSSCSPARPSPRRRSTARASSGRTWSRV